MFVSADIGKLFRAAACNDLKKVKFFIETKNAPATITNPAKQTLAHIAARNGYFDMLVYIVEKSPSVLRAVDSDAYSILQLAIEEGDFRMVKYLVENHAMDLHEQSKRGWGTAIHTAVEFDRLDILKYFIDEKQGDVNVRGKLENLPPVFLAVKYQYRDIIEFLIEKKQANLTIIDANHENLLYTIVRKNDLLFMKRLLDEKKIDFDINHRNYLGETLVHIASTLNRANILEYLVEEKHADLNIPRKKDNMTSLHCAAVKNHFEICKYLIEHGADTQLKDASQQLAGQKASDIRLIEYMKKASQVRRRRSISSSYPLFRPIIGCVQERDGISRLGPRSNDTYEQFHNLLMVAELIFGYVGSRTEHRFLYSPRIILQDKVDPVAVDAINNIPSFLK